MTGLFGWLVGWLVGWLLGWLLVRLFVCLFCFVSFFLCFFVLSVNRSVVGRLVGWQVAWLAGWLVVFWLIDWLLAVLAKCSLLVDCLTSQQHASVSQGRICTDNFTCYHTEIEAADQTFHLTQSQYTDTGPTSPSADPITPGAWQGSHWSANFEVTGMTRPPKNPRASGIRTRDLPLSRRTP